LLSVRKASFQRAILREANFERTVRVGARFDDTLGYQAGEQKQ
jgi:uncharacterized protein YjbI with pentapeptide repeats